MREAETPGLRGERARAHTKQSKAGRTARRRLRDFRRAHAGKRQVKNARRDSRASILAVAGKQRREISPAIDDADNIDCLFGDAIEDDGRIDDDGANAGQQVIA